MKTLPLIVVIVLIYPFIGELHCHQISKNTKSDLQAEQILDYLKVSSKKPGIVK